MSIGDFETQVLQLLALVIGSLSIWLLQRGAAWIGVRLSVDRLAQLEGAVDKVMTYGVTKASGIIAQRGWDHVDSKNAVVNFAITSIEHKFPDALRGAGLDMANPAHRERLLQMMDRIWPDVASRLSASPATPPAPVVPAVVVAAPAA